MDGFTLVNSRSRQTFMSKLCVTTSDAGRALWDSFIGFGFVFSASQFQYPAAVTFQPYI
jgi:hypothetical protein